MKSWKTTVAGVFTILAAVSAAGISYFNGHPIDFFTLASGVVSGVGLILAGDASKFDALLAALGKK